MKRSFEHIDTSEKDKLDQFPNIIPIWMETDIYLISRDGWRADVGSIQSFIQLTDQEVHNLTLIEQTLKQ